MTDQLKTLESELIISAKELLEKEYSRIESLTESELENELSLHSPIVNYKFNSKINYESLRFNTEFAPILEKILRYIAAKEFENKYRVSYVVDNTLSTERFFSPLDYKKLRLLVYKSLLLPVNYDEALEVLQALTSVISGHRDSQGLIDDLVVWTGEQIISDGISHSQV